MKIRRNGSNEEYLVLAIAWPSGRPKYKALDGAQTQFSGYDGEVLSDFYLDEFEILEPKITNFVSPNWEDLSYCKLVWEPLADVEFWRQVREFDQSALSKLQVLVNGAAEFSDMSL